MPLRKDDQLRPGQEKAALRVVTRSSPVPACDSWLGARDGTHGEDWQLMCDGEHLDMRRAARRLYLSHLVRSAPSVLELADLGMDQEANRADVWSPWVRSPAA